MVQNELLKKTQKAELYLLNEFDKVCRQNGLTYFLDSGTALGAIRHGGFIPWDDDIDVGMPRKDYNRFLEIGQQLLPTDIFLQTRQTDKGYWRNAAKLRLKGTIFPERNDVAYQYNGIFIDIFPFDNIPSCIFIARCNIKYLVGIGRIIRSYRRQSKNLPVKNHLFHRLLIKIPQTWIDRLEDYYLAYVQRNANKNTGKMTCYFWRMSLTKQYIFDSNKMLPVKDILFEGYPFLLMNNPDYYLKIMYGDYLKLPPKEQRVCHHIGEIFFGDFFSKKNNKASLM